MNATDFVTIQSFDLGIQADMLLLLLHQNDIPARLADEHIIAMEWALANAIGGIKVQVPIAYEFRARDIVSQHKAKSKSRRTETSSATDDDACLSCGFAMPEDQSVCTHCGWSYDH